MLFPRQTEMVRHRAFGAWDAQVDRPVESPSVTTNSSPTCFKSILPHRQWPHTSGARPLTVSQAHGAVCTKCSGLQVLRADERMVAAVGLMKSAITRRRSTQLAAAAAITLTRRESLSNMTLPSSSANNV